MAEDMYKATLKALLKEVVLELATEGEIKIDSSPSEDIEGETWSIEDFRTKCVGRKAKPWIKLYIFDAFADEITFKDGKGWLIPAHGKGGKNIIFPKPAKAWMEANRHRINWGAKLP